MKNRGRQFKSISKMSVWLLLLLLLLVSAPCVLAADSFPAPLGQVNDFASVLTSEERRVLQDKLSQLKKETGFEIVVATVETTYGEEPFNYSMRMIREWGVGDKERGGVLFLVITKDRKISVRVSTHGEGTVTDSQAGRARDAAAPYFKQKKWGEGLNAGVDVLIARVHAAATGDPLLQSPPATQNTQPQPQFIETTSSRSSESSDYLCCIPLVFLMLFVGAFLKQVGKRSGRTSWRDSPSDRWNSSPGLYNDNTNTQRNSFWGGGGGTSSWDNSSSSGSVFGGGGGSSWDSSLFGGSSDSSGSSGGASGSSSSDFGGSSSDSGGSFGGDSSSGGGADGSF